MTLALFKTIQGRRFESCRITRAVMMAVAKGDALGLPLEGKTAAEIARVHGRVKQLLPVSGVRYYPGEHPAGTASDETDLSVAMLDALTNYGLNMAGMAYTHAEAYNLACREKPGEPHPLGWGWSIGDAVLRLKQGVPWSESGKSDNPQMGYGNGVVIKLAPLALHLFFQQEVQNYFGRGTIDFLTNLTRMTHDTEIAVDASFAYLAALLYCLSNTTATFNCNQFINYVLFCSRLRVTPKQDDPKEDSRLNPDKLITRLELLREYPSYSPERIIAEFGGNDRPSYVYNSLPLTLMFFLRNPYSIETLYDVINAGEDADSNGSMVAALLACLHKDPAMFESDFLSLAAAARITKATESYCLAQDMIFSFRRQLSHGRLRVRFNT